jgi:inosine-uridine nucleoside N-ribohydrolase
MSQIGYFLLLAFFLCASLSSQAQKTPIIIDADTGNEMDDLYAIVRALLTEDFEVKGLTSAHFNNAQLLSDSLWHIYPTKNINTVAISQELNEELLQALDMEEILHPLGANRMLGYAWGYYEGAPIPSAPAIDFIIEQAEQVPEGEKLPIACLGAVTNVAAALETRPDLVSKLKVYMLGAQYDPARAVWNKSEFNIRNDLNAFDQLLNNQELELYVMPASTASVFRFDHQASLQKLSQIEHPVSDILARRWEEVSAGEKWTMWDLALIEAMIHPDMATLEKRAAPPENGGRLINVYTAVQPKEMEDAFWNSLQHHLP